MARVAHRHLAAGQAGHLHAVSLGAAPCALAPLHVPQLSRGHAVVDLAHSDLSHYLVEDLRGPAGGLAADADGFHDMEVLLDVFAPVEVERVGQVLDIDDVGEVRVGESQDAEGSHHGGVRAVPHADDLERDVGHFGGFDETFELRAHYFGTTDWAAQCGLVQHHLQARSVGLFEQGLPGHLERYSVFDLFEGLFYGAADHRAHVVLGLQQAGHELPFVGADQGGRALQVDVGAEPRGQDVAVVLPPTGLVGFACKRDQARHLDGIGHPVEVEQVHQVALLESDLAVLQPVDLPLRRADRLARLFPREPALRAQPSELRADQHATDSWSASWLSLGHVPASGFVWIRPSVWRTTSRACT